MTQQTLLWVRVWGWEGCEKNLLCECVTFLSCHWLALPLLCTFSIKQQSVIRARQRKKISTFYPLVEVTGTVAQLSWSAHTANSFDIPWVCEKLIPQTIHTMDLYSFWVGAGWGRDTMVMRWQVQKMGKLQFLVVDTGNLFIALTVAVTSEGMVVKRV